jgi:hypothetical protein
MLLMKVLGLNPTFVPFSFFSPTFWSDDYCIIVNLQQVEGGYATKMG